ncbi:MAG: transcriptional regulator [Gammaproteobacteria bacterium]|nr:MAG: transcriptional regulator [Gammaproteobacteria bacterium]
MGMIKHNFSDILFSKARQRVLGLLYSQPDRSFHTNEIIRLTHTGTGAIQRELEKLSKVGILTVKQYGNQKHYQANSAMPFFSELRGMVLKTFGLADILRQALKPIASQIYVAFIYGSIAKQEDTAHSDIDLMLVSDNLTYAELFQLLENAEAHLGRSINPTFYSPTEWARKLKEGNHFLTQIIKQPKIFLIGTEDDFTQFGKFSQNKAIKTGAVE